MDILSYLTDLLKTQKEVGIEGLGTFFKKKIPGKYDVENHLFIPPSHNLNFTTEVRDTDVLVDYISNARNISEESARYYIGLFAEDIHRQIAVNNQADLDSLGVLTPIDEQLTLVKQQDPNLGFEFYGLPKIRVVRAESESISAEEPLSGKGESAEIDPSEAAIQQSTPDLEEQIIEEPGVLAEETIKVDNLPIPLDVNDNKELDNQETYDEISEPQPVIGQVPGMEIETSEKLIEEEDRKEDEEPRVEDSNPAPIDQQLEVPDSFVGEQENQIQELNVPAKAISDNESANIWHFDREKSTPVKSSEEAEQTEMAKGSGWINYVVIGLVILIILAGVAYFVKPEWFGMAPKASVTLPKEVVQNKTPTPVKIDTVTTDSTNNAVTSADIDTMAKVGTPAVVPTEPKDSVTWEIIGASLTRREVNQYIKDMKARGFAAKAVTNMPGKRRIKMSIATFKDEESAKEGRRQLVKKLNNHDLYIFQNKNTQKPL